MHASDLMIMLQLSSVANITSLSKAIITSVCSSCFHQAGLIV